MKISPIPLTKKNFDKYGKVISIKDSDSILINNGYAQKYFGQCVMDVNEKDGKSILHIYLAKQRSFPLKINMLEKHPYFSQTFMPRSAKPFLVVVALGKDKPDLSTLKAFITDGNQGVFYNRGIWHFPLISIDDNEQFIVIDRTDCGKESSKLEECIEVDLDEDIYLCKEYL